MPPVPGNHNQLSLTIPQELAEQPVAVDAAVPLDRAQEPAPPLRTKDEIYGFTAEGKEDREDILTGQFSPREAAYMAGKTDAPLIEPRRDTPPARPKRPFDRRHLSFAGKLAADEAPPHVVAQVRKAKGLD